MNAVKSIYKADVNGKTFTFFHADYNVGCDGYEIPMPWENKHYLYVWKKINKIHEYYCFESDLFLPEDHAPWLVNNFFLK